MTAHATLSASGSERWLACPPSALLEKQFPDERSEYAAEGTFAHSLAELHIKAYLSLIPAKEYTKRLKQLKQNPFYSQEMEDYVQSYFDLAVEKINQALSETKDATVLSEQRLDFSPWVPGGFGTGDLVIISDGVLEIVDLKYGKGVPVAAEGNTQMRLYGLGAINQYGVLYDFGTVRMTIVQPRLDSISSAEMSVNELVAWGEEYVKPRAELAIQGKGEYNTGDHCQFCRAKAVCRARAEANLELARYDFQPPSILSVEEIADILTRADELQRWAKDVQDYALEQAINHGVKFPGWKLVEGRSNRKYTDEEAIAKILLSEGYSESEIYTKTLLGISTMEKAIGKKRFAELLGDLVIKPAGKPTLVPESDKRPEIQTVESARADFAELEGNVDV